MGFAGADRAPTDDLARVVEVAGDAEIATGKCTQVPDRGGGRGWRCGELHREGGRVRRLTRFVVHSIRVVGGQEDSLVRLPVGPPLDDGREVDRKEPKI